MTKPSIAEAILNGGQNGKSSVFNTVDPCLEGRKRHEYDVVGVCKHCGYERPTLAQRRVTRTSTSTSTARPTTSSSRTSKVEPSISLKDAREGMSLVLLLAQKVLIARVPALKDDELNPMERQLLAVAVTEELWDNNTVRRLLATAAKQQKHAKLSMALVIIALPRLKRHGIIPEEMDVNELAAELARQSAAAPDSGFGGGPDRGSEVNRDPVSVASWGSPQPDWGNGVGEVNAGGVAAETEEIRYRPTNETGRYSVAGTGGGEVPSSYEESQTRPDRVTTGSETSGPEEG